MSYSLFQCYFIFRMMSNSLSPEICKVIFGEELGKHMWEKWNRSERNLIEFISSLDTVNRDKLFEWAKVLFNGDAKLSNRF